MLKLNLDRETLDQCREMAESIVHPVLVYINRHSTVSVERAVLRLLGFNGAYEQNGKSYPMANLIVDKIGRKNLKNGIASTIAQIKKRYPRWTQYKMAEKIIRGEVNFEKLEDFSHDKLKAILKPWIDTAIRHIDKMRHKKEDMKYKMGGHHKPLKCVTVGTGKIDDDIQHAVVAAQQGCQIISVVRSTAQSLLDYIPHGETSEGFGGTFATQENFKLMREALDDLSDDLGQYIRLCFYSSGLCMPELSVLGAIEGADYMVNDALYATLFRDVNIKRTMIDQHFSRMIIARSGITINTGEDNYLKTADAFLNQHQVLASHFINEALAKNAGIRDDQIGLSHAFEIDPNAEDSVLIELAMVQLVREAFLRCSIKYLPPTKHKQGDIFFDGVLDTTFTFVGVVSGVDILCLGASNGTHQSPQMRERFHAIKGAQYVFKGCRSLMDEIHYSSNGKIMRHARQILDNTHKLLKQIDRKTLFEAIERGCFAGISRSKDGGKGFDGVFERTHRYYNPFIELVSVSHGHSHARR